MLRSGAAEPWHGFTPEPPRSQAGLPSSNLAAQGSIEEALDLLEAARDRVFVGPAIGPIHHTRHEAEPWGIPRAVARELGMERCLENSQRTCAALRERGVRVVMGGERIGLPVGQIRDGMLADLLLVDGDPLQDVRLIMKGGRAAQGRRGAQSPPTPSR